MGELTVTTLSMIADELAAESMRLANIEPFFQASTPQDKIDTHMAILRACSQAYSRAADAVRVEAAPSLLARPETEAEPK